MAAELYVLLAMADEKLVALQDLLASAATGRAVVLPRLTEECFGLVAVLGALTDNHELKQAIANHEAAPPEVLRQLAQDRAEGVRRAVARNPKTPADVLGALAEDGRLRLAVVANPAVPAELLARLARDWNPDVRRKVARHPNARRERPT